MDQRELLKNFYLFTGVTSNDWQDLEAIVERKVYIAGDFVYSEGDAADDLFLIEMGSVDIVTSGPDSPSSFIETRVRFSRNTFARWRST